MGRKREKVSVIRVMMDRNGWTKRKSVRHRGYDGQKWTDKEKKCPSSE
ncbi:hypothetical protein M3172_04405 [Mesobacillus subterraneus]|nr:hypothetical protein [Mesobacillus subterraneus]MCM3572418.1 hypothetical protein [Mesobacillus subterraneus]